MLSQWETVSGKSENARRIGLDDILTPFNIRMAGSGINVSPITSASSQRDAPYSPNENEPNLKWRRLLAIHKNRVRFLKYGVSAGSGRRYGRSGQTLLKECDMCPTRRPPRECHQQSKARGQTTSSPSGKMPQLQCPIPIGALMTWSRPKSAPARPQSVPQSTGKFFQALR